MLVATLSLLSPQLAVADDDPTDAESRELVTALMKTLRTREAFDQHVQNVVLSQIQRQPEVVAYRDVLTEFYTKYVGFEGLREPMTQSYLEHFSKQELSELLAFYSSPVGQKALSLLPSIASGALDIGIKNASEHNSELQGMIDAKAEMLNME
jgi:hypothetical protein